MDGDPPGSTQWTLQEPSTGGAIAIAIALPRLPRRHATPPFQCRLDPDPAGSLAALGRAVSLFIIFQRARNTLLLRPAPGGDRPRQRAPCCHRPKGSLSMMEDRLGELLSKGGPLVEFQGHVIQGLSTEVACEAVHALSTALYARPYGTISGKFRSRSVVFQLNPNDAGLLDVVLERVRNNPTELSAGYRWACHSFGKLASLEEKIFAYLGLSQPGAYDDGQAWP
jgi:hypothetical protein